MTKGKRNALYSWRDDTPIIIKEADNRLGVVILDREDYLAEAKKQLDDKEVYQELRDVESPLEKIIRKVIRKLRNWGDISHESLHYFSANNPKLGRFYLLPKIHKQLHDMPGRPVIWNLGFYLENISSFIKYHVKPFAQNVKSYITAKLDSLPPLPDDVMTGLYPNILHDEGLIAMMNALDLCKDKRISTESFIELAECLLKNNIFEHNLSFYKQLRGTAIGTKMATPYAIIFFGNLEERFFSDCDISPLVFRLSYGI